MSKQFYLIKLSDDHSKYTADDWSGLIKHIKNHDGKDISWSNHHAIRGPDENSSRPITTISVTCDSFKSTLTVG